jgi:hypothetical protein
MSLTSEMQAVLRINLASEYREHSSAIPPVTCYHHLGIRASSGRTERQSEMPLR